MALKADIIGYDLGVTGTFPVEWGKIREFAKAILDDNPAYDDPGSPEAVAAGGVVAPPTFTMVQAHWGASSTRAVPNLGLDLTRVLHGEQEFEYRVPIRAGDTLTARQRIADAYSKEGKRGGTMTFVVFETEFTNQRGEVACVARGTIIETARAAT